MCPEQPEQIRGHLAEATWRPGQKPEVTPSVEIELDRQLPAVLHTKATQQFFKVSVALPLNAMQVAAISNVQPDQITSTPMIRTENQSALF